MMPRSPFSSQRFLDSVRPSPVAEMPSKPFRVQVFFSISVSPMAERS